MIKNSEFKVLTTKGRVADTILNDEEQPIPQEQSKELSKDLELHESEARDLFRRKTVKFGSASNTSYRSYRGSKSGDSSRSPKSRSNIIRHKSKSRFLPSKVSTVKGMAMTRLATHTGIAESEPDYHKNYKTKVNENSMPWVSDYNFTMRDKEISGRKVSNTKTSHVGINSGDLANNSADCIIELKPLDRKPPLWNINEPTVNRNPTFLEETVKMKETILKIREIWEKGPSKNES